LTLPTPLCKINDSYIIITMNSLNYPYPYSCECSSCCFVGAEAKVSVSNDNAPPIPHLSRSFPSTFHLFERRIYRLALQLASCSCDEFNPCDNCRRLLIVISKSVPAPRLVGIHPHPGPNPKQSTALVVIPKRAKIAAISISNPKKKKKNKNKSRNSRLTGAGPAVPYIATLNDPFQYGAIKVGFGCMVPSTCVTAYYRGSLTAHADGSFAIFQTPTVGSVANTFAYNSSGLSVATWTPLAYTNLAVITAMAQEARVISGGIRAFPLTAATDRTGICYTGAVPSASFNQLAAITPTTLTSSAVLEFGAATQGATALIRPVDMESYSFLNQTITGGVNTVFSSSSPIILFTGLPASCPIIVEVCLNLEIISSSSSATSLTHVGEGGQIPLNDDLTSVFPSLDNLWNTTKAYLNSAGNLTTQLSATKIGDQTIQQHAMNFAVKGALHYFNAHRAGTRTLTSVQKLLM